MKTKIEKYKKICGLRLIILIFVLIACLGYYNNLKGFHLLQNIIGDGEYTLYIAPTETAFHTFQVNHFNRNATYEVYNAQNDRLVSQGNIGYTSEGYRPFIEMSLENSITYKVKLTLMDKHTFGFAHIELCD